MAGFLQRLVQRGLGRTRTVQPLYTARYARDTAPATLPAVHSNVGPRSAAPGLNRQADGAENEEQDKQAGGLARQAAANESEDENATDVARSPDESSEDQDDGDVNASLMRQKANPVQRRSIVPAIHRQSDEDGEGQEDGGAGDGGGDPGGSDAGLSQDSGIQTEAQEDEDLAPGRGNDTLSPKLHRSRLQQNDLIRGPRLFRQEESEEAGDDSANNSEDDTVSTTRETTISRRMAGPPQAVSDSGPTPNAAREQGPQNTTDRSNRFSSESSSELLMPPESQSPASSERASISSESNSDINDHSGGVRIDSAAGDDLTPGRPSRSNFGLNPLVPGRSARSTSFSNPRGESSQGPEIQISIGRIEIRAVGDGAEGAQPAVYDAESKAKGQMQSLEDYLKRRNGEVQ